MSGICGWVGGGISAHDVAIRTMADLLPQLGVGVSQHISFEGAGLAIRSNGAEGSWYQDSACVAAIEGNPVWRSEDLAATSRHHGHAAALAQAWRKYSDDLLNQVGGDFGLAVLDLPQNRGLLAIDRFGIRTLNYSTKTDGGIVFGSTLDSLKGYPGTNSKVRLQAIYKFLYFVDRIPAPETIYEECRKILPGHCVIVDRDRVSVRRYWRMPYADENSCDIRSFRPALFAHLEHAIKRTIATEDERKIGAFLSGGVDSSSVVGVLQGLVPACPIKSITVAFSDARFDESKFAQITADHFHTEHHVYLAEPRDVLDSFEKISRSYDEPFANSSAVAVFLAARKAKEVGVEVLLAGDGGDELFGGNSRYVDDAIFDHYTRIPFIVRKFLLEPAADLMPACLLQSYIRRTVNYVRIGRMTPAERMMKDNIYRHLAPKNIFQADVYRYLDIDEPKRFVNEIFANCPSHDKLHRMFEFDMRVTLADSDLRKVVRMCELVGVRVKFPFLDDDVAGFSATVSPALLMQNGILRFAYKKAMEGFLPQATLTKKKHGFGLPYVEFVQAFPPLTDLFCDALTSLAKRKLFRSKFLYGLIKLLRQGEKSPIIGVSWDLAVLEVWLASRSISL